MSLQPFAIHVLNALNAHITATRDKQLTTGEPVARLFLDGKARTSKDVREAFPNMDINKVDRFLSRYRRKGFFLDGRRYFLNRIRLKTYVINGGDA